MSAQTLKIHFDQKYFKIKFYKTNIKQSSVDFFIVKYSIKTWVNTKKKKKL